MQLDTDSQREILEEIAGEAEGRSRMVEDLLFLAGSDSESLPLNLETVPVPALFGEFARRAEALACGLGVPLHTALAGEGTLKCDVERIEQAALVLVDNAAKYGARGAGITFSSRKSCPASSRASTAARAPQRSGARVADRPHHHRSARRTPRGDEPRGRGNNHDRLPPDG